MKLTFIHSCYLLAIITIATYIYIYIKQFYTEITIVFIINTFVF